MSPLTTTPGQEALLKMVGVESEEALFDKLDTGALGMVNMQAWQAFDSYRYAEKNFRDQVVKTADEATRQLGYLEQGCTPDASWFENYAEHAVKAQAQMLAAVNDLHHLVAIRNLLVVTP